MSTRMAATGSSAERFETWLAWSLVVLSIAAKTAGLTLQIVTGTPEEPVPGGFLVLAISAVAIEIWSVIGAVIVSRYPRHPIGWILCVIPVVSGVDSFVFGYAAYALILRHGALPGADIMVVWAAISSSEPFFLGLLILLLLLYPDGRFLSPGWRLLAWLVIGAGALEVPLAALKPGPVEDLPAFITNPIGLSQSVWAILGPLWSIAYTLPFLCLLAAALSLILRLRRARGDERQQVKWFAYTGALLVAGLLPFSIPGMASEATRAALMAGYAVTLLTVAGLPITMAIAIFKYRLYDIDVIINRTLVYGGLSGTLAVVYFGSVALLQRLLPAESQLAVVLSTLAIAALFNPLRRRMQEAIDRRFYRKKYDAAKTLADFAAAARDETDLDELAARLVDVVEETMQPQSASLWLRQPTGRK
jgi:hypothetical protein